MSTYALLHHGLMWGFYALGVACCTLLLLAGLAWCLGWCADRWHRRHALREERREKLDPSSVARSRPLRF